MRKKHAIAKRLLALLFSAVACSCAGANVILPPRSLGSQSSADAAPVDVPDVPGCSGLLPVSPPPGEYSQPITVTAFFPIPEDESPGAVTSGDDAAVSPPVPTDLHYLLPAAVIAMEEVNRELAAGGYHLELDVRNTRCDPFTAVNELVLSRGESRSGNTPHLGILGPGCLDVVQSLSPLAHGLFLPQVSYANDTNIPVIFGERKREYYPDLFQMVRNLHQTTKTALVVMDHFEWTEKVGFVYDDDLIYTTTVEQLVSIADEGFVLRANENVTITVPDVVFTELLGDQKTVVIEDFMRSIRRQEIRVIAGLVGEESACKLVCEAKKGVIPGDGFVWLFIGAYQEEWWKNEAACTCKLNASDVESVILVSSQVKNTLSNGTFALGNTLANLKQDYLQRLHQWCPETKESKPNTFFATTYDALLALGIAINATLDILNATLADYSPYGNATVPGYNTSVYQTLYNSLSNTDFTGASGGVTFSRSGVRLGVDIVNQIQNGNAVTVGQFNSQTEELMIEDNALVWPGGDDTVPNIYPEEIRKTATESILAFAVAITLASNMLTVVILVFVIRYRRHRIFLASGQRLNYFIITGAFTAFTTVYLFALLESPVGQQISKGLFDFFCIVRLYMIMLSFTLTFGTLFVRAWRIYRIFNNPFVTQRKYTDTYLMLMVGVLALIDIVLVSVYVGADRYGRYITMDDLDYDSFTVCTYLGCMSRQFFVIGTGILGIYKVLQMLLFVFVVSLVRRGVIERKIYDDSKWLALTLYVSAVFFLIGLPVQVVLQVSLMVAEALAVNMIWVNVTTDFCMIAIYTPKLYQIMYKKVDTRILMTQKSKFYLYTMESRSSIL